MRGFDPEELDRQIAKGNERQEALGLSFDTNVKAETSQGQEGVVNGNRRDLSAA
jgi:capsid protein